MNLSIPFTFMKMLNTVFLNVTQISQTYQFNFLFLEIFCAWVLVHKNVVATHLHYYMYYMYNMQYPYNAWMVDS